MKLVVALFDNLYFNPKFTNYKLFKNTTIIKKSTHFKLFKGNKKQWNKIRAF